MQPTKALASLQVILMFFFYFSKKWVSQAMGNKTFYGDGIIFCFACFVIVSVCKTIICIL